MLYTLATPWISSIKGFMNAFPKVPPQIWGARTCSLTGPGPVCLFTPEKHCSQEKIPDAHAALPLALWERWTQLYLGFQWPPIE